MAGVSRKQFFSRIEAALRNRGEPVPLPEDVEIARVMTADIDRVGVFTERAEQVNMKVCRVADESAAAEKVAQIVSGDGGRSVVLPVEAIPARDAIAASLASAGVRLSDVDDPDASFEADFGVTGVELAVAETASLFVDSGGSHRRLASLAVPNHIAVVRADQIVPDLLDWPAALPGTVPANRVLISAPSKTADIEMTIIEGVHGPKMVYVVIVG